MTKPEARTRGIFGYRISFGKRPRPNPQPGPQAQTPTFLMRTNRHFCRKGMARRWLRCTRELLAQVDRVDSEIVSESGSEIASESVSKSVPGRMVRGGRNFAPADGFAQYVEAEGLIGRFLGMRERWPQPVAGPQPAGLCEHTYIIASNRHRAAHRFAKTKLAAARGCRVPLVACPRVLAACQQGLCNIPAD